MKKLTKTLTDYKSDKIDLDTALLQIHEATQIKYDVSNLRINGKYIEKRIRFNRTMIPEQMNDLQERIAKRYCVSCAEVAFGKVRERK